MGRAATILFTKEGAKVIAASRNVGAGEETAKLARSNGGEATFVQTDISIVPDVENMIAQTLDTYGKLDVLYNNAATLHEPVLMADISIEDWQRVMAVNLMGTWLTMKYAIPEMIKSGGGSIINTTSIAAHRGVYKQSAYSATKGGIIALSRAAAVEYSEKGVRTNCISPGPIATPMLVGFYGDEGVKRLGQMAPRKQIGDMGEVAQLAVFLASDESAHIIGQTIRIDGGHSIDSHIY
jgi:NAD(P)-dependent dehydrogenase (short-subunit alcohol dehydrogenase family)